MSLDGLRKDEEIPADLVEDGLVDAKTGHLDKAKLYQALNQLAQARQHARAIR